MARNYTRKAGYNRNYHPSVTTQVDERQILNDAGGYVFKVDDMNRLRRFLIFGTEGGTYYVSERKLTRDNADFITGLLESRNGLKAIDEVVDVSNKGQALKNDPAIFVLALAATCNNPVTRSYALKHLKDICRISTHLFTFLTYVKDLKSGTGWGRALRNAIADWYNSKSPSDLAYQVCKYPSRKVEGSMPWSHKDVLRKAHVVPFGLERDFIYQYIVAGFNNDKIRTCIDKKGKTITSKTQPVTSDLLYKFDNLRYIRGHEMAKNANRVDDVIDAIEGYGVTRESIPNEYFSDIHVWEALFVNMPMTAMIRNLGKMTEVGLLAPFSDATKTVVDVLGNKEILKKSRIHPLQVFSAWRTYKSGHGFKGGLTWNPVPAIVGALEDAFYKSFEYVEPTGKNILLSIDMSGSMGYNVSNIPDTNLTNIAAIVAMTIVRTEPNYHVIGFDTKIYDNLNITKHDSLETVIKKINPRGGTNISLTFKHAMEKNIKNIDAFVILTDNETYLGEHPFRVFDDYKRVHNSHCKLVYAAMNATQSTLIHPNNDGNSMDIVGWSNDVPKVISEFIKF